MWSTKSPKGGVLKISFTYMTKMPTWIWVNDAGDLVLVFKANNNHILTFFFLNTDKVR